MTTNEEYRQRMEHRLRAKIKARNEVHRLANEVGPILRKVLEPWIGKKVVIGGPALAAKVKADLEKALAAWKPNGVHYWLPLPAYNIHLSLNVTASDGGEHISADENVYLGELEGQTLKELCRHYPQRTDHNEAEVLAWREELKELESRKGTLISKLNHFGIYDH